MLKITTATLFIITFGLSKFFKKTKQSCLYDEIEITEYADSWYKK